MLETAVSCMNGPAILTDKNAGIHCIRVCLIIVLLFVAVAPHFDWQKMRELSYRGLSLRRGGPDVQSAA